MFKKLRTVVIVLIVAVILLVPTVKTTIPEWQVLVVDRLDNPLPNTKIRQVWSFHLDSYEEVLTTNDQGVVVFAQRQRTDGLLVFSIAFMVKKINSLVMLHGTSKTPYALVDSAEGLFTNRLYFAEGKPMEHKLVIRSRP